MRSPSRPVREVGEAVDAAATLRVGRRVARIDVPGSYASQVVARRRAPSQCLTSSPRGLDSQLAQWLEPSSVRPATTIRCPQRNGPRAIDGRCAVNGFVIRMLELRAGGAAPHAVSRSVKHT